MRSSGFFPGGPASFRRGRGWDQVITKMVFIIFACIAVALLSSLLSEQTRRSKRELHAMGAHVKRVEKMAAIGEMAAGLAHEIKNPLASMSGAIQLLREDMRCDPDHDRLMQIILREADRLSALVSNFLLYARPPAGKPEPLKLDKALQETIELFGKKTDLEPRIAITLNAQPGVWTRMDPSHLRQVLWNLLVNASEAIDETGEIRVELAAVKDKQLCLKIADTGAGMPPEILQSIFDPFFTTKANGTGLGLSIVHRILESYGCRLDVDSAPGRGTSVRLYLKQIDPPVRRSPPDRTGCRRCRLPANRAPRLDSPSQIDYPFRFNMNSLSTEAGHAPSCGRRRRCFKKAPGKNSSAEAEPGAVVSQRLHGAPHHRRAPGVTQSLPRAPVGGGPRFRAGRPDDGRQPLRQGRLHPGPRPQRAAAGLRSPGPGRRGGRSPFSNSWTSGISWA
jgi:signal transduction histidine kinase